MPPREEAPLSATIRLPPATRWTPHRLTPTQTPLRPSFRVRRHCPKPPDHHRSEGTLAPSTTRAGGATANANHGGTDSASGPGIPGPRHADIRYRPATPTDGANMWELVRSAGKLELNPSYAYILLCQHFGDTCLVAEKDERVVGFVLAYVPPRQPDTVFVWQVGVSSRVRKRGVGIQLLRHLLALDGCRNVRFIEASVTPSNTPSQNLFRSFARKWGVPCRKLPFFPATFFPDAHEAEDLYRVGPLEWPEA